MSSQPLFLFGPGLPMPASCATRSRFANFDPRLITTARLSLLRAGLLLGLLCGEGAVASGAPRPNQEKRRLILCNDGGTLAAPNLEAPIGVAGLIRSTIDPLRDTTVDTLYWQIGTDPYFGTATSRLSDWYSHRTKVGIKWGEGRSVFKTAGEWRVAENERQLEQQGTDSAEVVITEGHKAGLDVFLSLRINDGHDARLPDGLADANMAPQRHAHPEWLLGDDAIQPPNVTGRLATHMRFTYDFSLPQVRQYILALVQEAIANYDLDGFDLDFCRQPSLFKKGQAESGGRLVTELLRDIRRALDAKGQAAGRRLYLSMRVPPDLAANKSVGINVDTWIKERIADIVVVGDPGGWHYRLPIEDYLALAKGTECKIIAQNLCAFREDRGRSASVLFGERSGPASAAGVTSGTTAYYTTEQFRAVAARHWQAGADGQYIWNQHFLQFSADDNFDRQHWKEIGDPQILAHLNKHYLVGPTGKGGSLPIVLAAAGAKATVNVEVADDVGRARREGYAAKATLRFEVEQLTSLDQIELSLNGVRLDPANARVRLNYNDSWMDLDVTSTIKKGANEFVVQVNGRNPHVGAPLTLLSVEALVTYK